MPVWLDVATPGFRNVVSDIRGERGFAHAGAAGENSKVGLLQPPHHPVEVIEPGGGTGKLAIALKRMRGHIDGCGERLRKALEAPVVSTGFRQLVKPSLRVFDLSPRRKIDRCIVRDVDHILADLDERTTDRQVVNRMPVV